MKHFVYSLLGCLLFSLNTAFAQKTWSFDEQNPLLSADGKSLLELHTVKQIPEFVAGMDGKALRTDGYSTWLDATVEGKFFSLSGWFALESYPTDTAAFVGIKDASGHSIAVCTDRYGELLLGTGEGTSYSYYPLGAKVERFKWLHFLLDFKNKSIYLNGFKLEAEIRPTLLHDSKTFLRIGKDFRDKKVWMYDVTAINGLIDEINMSTAPVNWETLRASIDIKQKKKPVLAIPETRFAADFNRPRYHLLPAANWTNETHGLIHYKGNYHIFNQKNASAIFLGQINWGHFSSPDLLHWTEEKPALTPDAPYDKNGIWSGCAVIDDSGIPQLIYTAGGDKMGVGIAFPKDKDLIEWEKYAHNPVIAEHPAGYTRIDMRDQYVWKENGVWYMVIGYGIEDANNPRGALLLYKSVDLKKWDFVHLLFEGNPKVDASGIFWEMPVFKKMGNKYVLLVNRVPHNGVPARCQYWVGDFKDEKFIPDSPVPRNLEVINRLLSPSVVETPKGEMVAISIIPDEIGGKATYEQGWAHLYSIPRKWRLEDGKICQSPHPVLQQLRESYKNFPMQKIMQEAPCIIHREGHQLEVKATIYPGDATRFGVVIGKNPDNSEYSRIYFDIENQELVVDQTRSSLREHIPLNIRKDKYHVNASEPVEIHLFIDGSVVEGFINNQDAFTTRIFPLKKNSTQVELFSDGQTTEIAAEVWKLKDAKVKMNF